MAGLNTGNAKAALKARGDDLYETPEVATQALLRAEKLPETIWEPACGPGSIVRTLRGAGHMVYATDLVNYECPDSEHGVDFLMERHPSFYIGAIVTNPPFKLANEFAHHALDIGVPKVIMLLRLAFIESERRRGLLDGGWLARVHVFRNRLPMMHRAGRGTMVAKTNSSAMAFAWFVWDRDHKGPTELRRLSWSANESAPAEHRTIIRKPNGWTPFGTSLVSTISWPCSWCWPLVPFSSRHFGRSTATSAAATSPVTAGRQLRSMQMAMSSIRKRLSSRHERRERMPNFREFKVGEKVRILEDRRESWQTDEEMEIAKVYDHHRFVRGVGHTQTLTMTNGDRFSGWWFDPAAKCRWAKNNKTATV